MGRLGKLAKEYAGSAVQFLGVCVDVYDDKGDTYTSARSYISSTGADYPILMQTSALTAGVAYLPSTHIFDSSGKLIAKYTGTKSESDWINIIETLAAR